MRLTEVPCRTGLAILALLIPATAWTSPPTTRHYYGSFASFSRGPGKHRALVERGATSIDVSVSTQDQPVLLDSETLLAAAESFMQTSTGYYSALDEDRLADDFVFRGPVIGPLGKHDYARVLEYFAVYRALPDVAPNAFGFSVDPEDPRRVWFLLRATGTYQQSLGGALGNLAATVTPPDQRQYRGSTEVWSLTFNERLQVRYLSAGYVADLYEPNATTGGRGLTFGVLASLGLPLPAGVGSPVLQVVQKVSRFLAGTGIVPLPYSSADNVPSWWKSDKFGA